MNKSDIIQINNDNNKLLFNDDSSLGDISEKNKTSVGEENIEIPKLLNYTIKNSRIPLLNLDINLHLSNKKYNDNKSLLFLKLNYNLITPYISKG